MEMDVKVKPEYEALWGELPRAEFKALKESIRADGFYKKIDIMNITIRRVAVVFSLNLLILFLIL